MNSLRQDPIDKVEAKLTPDTHKTTTEHIGDKIAGNADKVGSHAQPQSDKTTTQKVVDAVTPGNTDGHHATGHHATTGHTDAHIADNRTMGEKVKDAVGLGHH